MVLAHNIEEVQRTDDVQTCHETKFDTMMLSTDILNGLTSAGFYKPSPIQLLGIPLGKLGLDLVLEAKSGTGKTVVFTTIALEKLNLDKGLQVIIVTPTREIAAQICDVLKQIGSKCEGLAVEVAIGGLPYEEDVEKLKNKVHILVCTPGRLKYLIRDKHIDTSAIRLFVLDEADKLMEKSFHGDIKYIYSALPRQKQVILSSATFPDSVVEVVNEFVQDAQHVCPNSNNVLLGVSHRVTFVKYNSNSVRQTEIRFNELIKILSELQFKQCVIFCKYQARVSQLHKMLTKAKWPADLVYGKQDQTVRLEALKTLQEYKCRILISTDLVSRGIDAKNVDLVINFELPENCETYLHRIGRSGRYGSIGTAVSIISEGDEVQNFYKLIEPISCTIHLEDLWTREKLNNDSQDQCREKPATMKDIKSSNSIAEKNNNFWNYLLVDTNQSGHVESFDQLCFSYNVEDITKIESFSELLDDYTNSERINTEDECLKYKHLEFENLSFKKYLEAVHNLKEKFNIDNGNNGTSIINNCFSHQNKEDMSLETKKFKEVKMFKNNSQRKVTKYENISLDLKKPDHVRKKAYTDANSFVSELPQAFHESKIPKANKTKKQIHNQQKLTKEHNDIKKYEHADKLCNFENLQLDNVHKMDTPVKKVNQSSNSNNMYNCYNYDDRLFKTHSSSRKTSSSTYSDVIHSEPNDIDKTEYMEKVSTYHQWYNQLKTRVKQIEQILYIEEMSKH